MCIDRRDQYGWGAASDAIPLSRTRFVAGRLAEAVTWTLKGAEHLGSAPEDRGGRRLAGAPEPKQIETGQGIALEPKQIGEGTQDRAQRQGSPGNIAILSVHPTEC